MNAARLKCFCILLSFTISVTVEAETAYITDSLSVGLHEDKSLDSPIVKIVHSGTSLDIIKREDKLTYVRGQQGTSGWIDNSYLKKQPPASEQLKRITAQNLDIKKKLEEVQQKLKSTKPSANENSGTNKQLSEKNSLLQKQFNAERLKADELQVQISELRNRIGQNNDNASLYKNIDQLTEQAKNLEIQLANALDLDPSARSTLSTTLENENGYKLDLDWKNLLIYLLISTTIGLCIGIYLMDTLNRRKHGGFRM